MATNESQPTPPPPLDADLVKSFVIAGHHDLDTVKRMLDEAPSLLNAAWDWGGGDFETAVGAAGHMGRRDIAELLIGRGARYDLFVAAMLDEVETVQAILTSNPQLKESLGPHGILLIVHAQQGKATRVLELLSSL